MAVLDYSRIDRENIEFLIGELGDCISAIYRTGSTVKNKKENYDIDYLVITDEGSHSGKEYVLRRMHIPSRTPVDYVVFTCRDLKSPSTISSGRVDKIRYLMREITRERILLHGGDSFAHFLDEDDLKSTAKELGIDSGSMDRTKQFVPWE